MKTPNRTFLFTLLGVFVGLLAGALMMLIASRPRGEPVELRSAPTPAPILVDVTGAILQAGVYALARDSRVQDAVEAAGGFSQDADRDATNLAARIADGDKITIPRMGEAPGAPLLQAAPGQATQPPEGQSTPRAKAPVINTPSGPVNINTATLDELLTLPGIGATRAQDIIDYRQANGGFKTSEEIQNIIGIGPATYEKLREKITIN